MSIRSRVEGTTLVLAVLALFALLVIVIGSLDELSFQPGKLLPRKVVVDDDEGLEPRASLPPALTPHDRLVASILGALTLVSVVCVFIFRKVRKLLLQYLFILIAVALPVVLGMMYFGSLFSGWFQHRGSGEVAAASPDIPDSLLASPPTWSMALAAGAVSLLVLGAAAYFVRRWLAYRAYVDRRKSEIATLQAQQQIVAEQAAQAASRIRQGKSPQGEVIRCYQQMSRWLAKKRNIKPTYLTAREFASSLTDLGIHGDHVQALTALFELVRYGERDDGELAEQALDCLDHLRMTYAMKEDE